MKIFFILYGGPCDFQGKIFSDFASFLKIQTNQQTHEITSPGNVPIFMTPRKLGPTKINDITVSMLYHYYFRRYGPGQSFVTDSQPDGWMDGQTNEF